MTIVELILMIIMVAYTFYMVWDMAKNKNKKIITQKMWAIVGNCGLYAGTAYTRKGIKEHHMAALGYLDWKECAKKGDIAIKVLVTPLY